MLLVVGSSPRGRGTCKTTRGGGRRTWFIPARAGNMYGLRAVSLADSVHPRAGGEHLSKSICQM